MYPSEMSAGTIITNTGKREKREKRDRYKEIESNNTSIQELRPSMRTIDDFA
jgi:hypothetical protein